MGSGNSACSELVEISPKTLGMTPLLEGLRALLRLFEASEVVGAGVDEREGAEEPFSDWERGGPITAKGGTSQVEGTEPEAKLSVAESVKISSPLMGTEGAVNKEGAECSPSRKLSGHWVISDNSRSVTKRQAKFSG